MHFGSEELKAKVPTTATHRLAIFLEGSPGVGTSRLILAIVAASGHKVVRINLLEQTDMMDLLGSDLPVEGV